LSDPDKADNNKTLLLVNMPSLLQIVERLERLAGRLPSKIRKAVLSELTPLKQLFLQQRPPRFLFAGSARVPAREMISALFRSAEFVAPNAPVPLFRWFDVDFPDQGKMSVIDVRGVDHSTAVHIRDELKYRPADMIFFIHDDLLGFEMEQRELADINSYLNWNETVQADRKTIEVIVPVLEKAVTRDHNGVNASREKNPAQLTLVKHGTFLETLRLIALDNNRGFELPTAEARRLMSTLARELPNEARMEMIRISRDRDAQREVAQLLVKSTTAVCTAIGAQPIPLADLPILTSLQMMMVSGIMYVSGRERSLRAAAEFVGAVGANVGAAMLLREGARAVLKFFPGWGNVVCGLVAGSGTYGIGRAATAYFIEGASLKDARRTYLTSRKKRRRQTLEKA
jgi:uncharacterized protein (DUF697 family)